MAFELSQKTAFSSTEDTSQGKDLWNSLFIQPQFFLKQYRQIRKLQVSPEKTAAQWNAVAMQAEQRTYWEECWQQFARAGHCVTHLLSGHLGLLSTSNISLLPITSSETAKLGIPHPALRHGQMTAWQANGKTHLSVTFCKPIVCHLHLVSGVASGPHLEFENFSSKEQSPEVRHRQCTGTLNHLFMFAYQQIDDFGVQLHFFRHNLGIKNLKIHWSAIKLGLTTTTRLKNVLSSLSLSRLL